MNKARESSTPPEVNPPVEPRLAYPEPVLVADELLALIRGSTFYAANRHGDLTPPGAPHIGLFYSDTRFLSQFELRVNGSEPSMLSSTTIGAHSSAVELTARGGLVPGENLDLAVNTIYVHREQLLEADRFTDLLEIRSFADKEVTLTIHLQFAADFMDIFQVRGLLRGKSGHYYEPEMEDSRLRFLYLGLDNRSRTTELQFTPRPHVLEKNQAVWQCRIAPHGGVRLSTSVGMHVGGPADPAIDTPSRPSYEEARDRSSLEQEDWQRTRTSFRSDNEIFDALLQTSAEDFYALRMPEPAGTTVAAGVPWFAALFGRDSLLSSYETLVLDPALARGTLRVLASYQGRVRNDERDEDPGKILHERRGGEMTATDEVPFGRSYGSVDSTPLFLILAHEYFRWTADHELLRDLKRPLEAATNWILEYGDLDGDGLVEYCRRNPKGLANQGWKDSGDANRHEDGRYAQPPIALIEVQGYAARALAGSAELLDSLGADELAKHAKARAEQIRHLIEKRFWLQDREYYAMALDKEKEPLRVDGSNPGHLLFSRAITPQRARQVADRLLGDEMFSGWGIRTLSSGAKYFNPMSYHCGSVWPHDNAIIGYGLARYGLHAEASAVFQGLYDAALHFRDYRLPELFCGVERQLKSDPVHYPVSCSPQAWASGAPYLLLTGLLGLCPLADRRELAIVDPDLPSFLNSLRLDNLRIGSSRISLEFQRQGERTHCNVADVQGTPLKISIVIAGNQSTWSARDPKVGWKMK